MAGEEIPDVLSNPLDGNYYANNGTCAPLRDFWGKLKSIGLRMIEGSPELEILYNFDDVKVIKSITAYTETIAEISIVHSTEKGSNMEVFESSIDRLLNVDNEGNTIPKFVEDEKTGSTSPNPKYKIQAYMIGKYIHMVLTPNHLLKKSGKVSENIFTDMWEVFEIRDT
jgi:hypothetical protein